MTKSRFNCNSLKTRLKVISSAFVSFVNRIDERNVACIRVVDFNSTNIQMHVRVRTTTNPVRKRYHLTASFHFLSGSNPDLELIVLDVQFARVPTLVHITGIVSVSLVRLRHLSFTCARPNDATQAGVLARSRTEDFQVSATGNGDQSLFLPSPPAKIRALLTPITTRTHQADGFTCPTTIRSSRFGPPTLHPTRTWSSPYLPPPLFVSSTRRSTPVVKFYSGRCHGSRHWKPSSWSALPGFRPVHSIY